MKKIYLFLTLIFCICLTIITCSCSQNNDKVKINTTLTIDSSNSGIREMRCDFPLPLFIDSTYEELLDNIINSNCPSELSYIKSNRDQSISYTFYLEFSSYNDYKTKIKSIIGVDSGVILSAKDTILTKGTSYSENFSSKNLLFWLNNACLQNDSFSNVKFDNYENSAFIDGTNQETGEFINFNNAKGYAIDNINIDTFNNDNNFFDRTVTFQIPYTTTKSLGDDLINYMNARTQNASDTSWVDYASGSEFTVTYTNLTPFQLMEYTNELFNSDLCGKIEFNKNNDITSILSEEYKFEENLDLSSYLGKDNNPVAVNYNYYTRNNNLFSAQRYFQGNWVTSQNNSGSSAQFSGKALGLCFSATSGNNYSLLKTNITLKSTDDYFTRIIDFVFDKNDTVAALHVKDFLTSHSIEDNVNLTEDEDSITCSIILSGTVDDITNNMRNIFGEKNSLQYKKTGETFDLHYVTTVTDTLDTSNLYKSENITSPIYYNLEINGNDSLTSLKYVNSKFEDVSVNLKESNDNITLKLDSPTTSVVYTTEKPKFLGVFILVLISLIFIMCVILVIIKIKNNTFKIKKKNNIPTKSPDEETVKKILSDI